MNIDQITTFLSTNAITYGFRILGAIAIFLVGRWVAQRLIDLTKRSMRRANVDATLVNFVGNIGFYLLLALVIIAALGQLGVNTTSVIAILGGATLALGLALQDSLGNLAAGIMIILLRPYRLNDFVEINGEQGEVTSIKIFHTQLTTPFQKVVLVPNNEVIQGNITNYSVKGLYRYDMVFGIGYGDDIRRAKEIIQEILEAEERIVDDPAPSVLMGELGDSSVNLIARPWISYREHPVVKSAVTEQVKLRFDAEGISIPFPQRDVHLFQAN